MYTKVNNFRVMRKLIALSTLLLILFGGQACSTTKGGKSADTRKSEIENRVNELVDSREFEIDVKRAMPRGGRSINLTSIYNVKISGDSIYSYLPYFGTAYNIPYGGGDGLTFNSTVREYECNHDKKDTHQISFKTRSNDDNLEFFITIFKSGSTTIQVHPINRAPITFNGDLQIYDKR